VNGKPCGAVQNTILGFSGKKKKTSNFLV